MLNRNLIVQTICLFLTCILASPLSATPIEYAQNNEESTWENIVRRIFRRPSEDERSDSAGSGGANHDRCLYTTEELVAIVPISSETQISYLEPTISDYPTWWFYNPYPGNGRLEAEFALIDSTENILYRQKFLVPATPGLLSFSLPYNEQPLTSGKNYRWVFSIICNPSNRSGDATVNGWIRKVDSFEASELADRLALSQRDYLVYAEYLYWFDLLSELNRLRIENPEVSMHLWNSLICKVYSQYPRLESLTESCDSSSTFLYQNLNR